MKLRALVATATFVCALTSPAISQSSNSAKLATPQVLGAADPATTTHFSVFLPLRNTAALEQLVADQTNSSSPSYHQWLTPSEFKSRFGPNPGDVQRVINRLEGAGFTITAEHTQSIEVTGPVAAVEALFSTRLNQVKTRNGKIRLSAHARPLTLPAELAAAGAVIPAFYPELAAHVHSSQLAAASSTLGQLASTHSVSPDQRISTAALFYLPDDLNEAYSLPSFQTEAGSFFSPKKKQIAGVGSHIAIVIDSVIDPADINNSFNTSLSLGPFVDIQDYSAVSNLPVPSVTIRPVDGGSGPFNPGSASAVEASLDTQMSLGTAPGAQETIYDMPDLTYASEADAYAAIDDDNSVDVVSSSFGGCELYFTAAYNGGTDFTSIPKQIHQLFLQGNAQGITFLASSGDSGAVPCLSSAFINNPTDGTSFVKGVEYPASDPSVSGIGGTNLVTVPTPTPNDSTYSQENAQFDPLLPAEFELAPGDIVSVNNNTWGSGGGYSVIFPKPLYQLLTPTSQPGRAVPDASLMMGGCPADADIAAGACSEPTSADIIWVGGGLDLVIGTSSSSPEMAGVLALDVELNGRMGNANPLIYSLSLLQTVAGGAKAPAPLQYFHRNIQGNNNGYTVTPGQPYSTVLGNGTLDVKNFLQLQNAAPAGTPGTPSNP
ncbi:MAG TPA: S53 family serine peptidase [Acidobacteriaceae bacterium]|nr:S53 family serine peptidase [Acidobacteriaceae bacterium]